MANKLEEARKIINEVDEQMAQLFLRRMQAAELVYAHKKEYGLPILDARREAQVIAANTARIPREDLRGYYEEFLKNTMALSRAYQYRMQESLRVACCLAEQETAQKIFPGCSLIPCSDPEEAWDAVSKEDCHVAVLPLETDPENPCKLLHLLFTGDLFLNGIYASETSGSTGRFAVISRVMAQSPALPCRMLLFTAESPREALEIPESYGFSILAQGSSPLPHDPAQRLYRLELEHGPEEEALYRMLEAMGRVSHVRLVGSFSSQAII